MDITIVTSAPTNEEALDLLKMMGMPSRKNEDKFYGQNNLDGTQ